MSEEKEVGSASLLEGPTAAQIKEQIDSKQRELKRESADKPVVTVPEPALEVKSATPENAVETPIANKPPEPAPDSGAGEAPGPEGKDKPAWKKWIEKKGFKGPEDMVRSMRELERELHRRSQGNGAQAPTPALPENPPLPRPSYPAPAPNVEEIAKRYNLDPEDLQRVAPLAADIAASHTARELAPLKAELSSLRRELSRSSELQGLKEDPAFSDPRVQFEMHQILEMNPSILQNEPAPYRFAFNEALRSMGRRILEGSIDSGPVTPTVSGPPALPTTPPRTAGGSGSGSAPVASGSQPPQKISMDAFNRLPAAEQRKILEGMGLIGQEF